jgi:hypothetical protein
MDKYYYLIITYKIIDSKMKERWRGTHIEAGEFGEGEISK